MRIVGIFFSIFHTPALCKETISRTSRFVGRNSFAYTDPGQILGCLAYNFTTMMAGEVGYTLNLERDYSR